jgi:SpoVK/Ycf46/Vps4 family AAA+-type ATPase
MGVLLCGPSGTGKTLLVYALARASGFNCVKIDMSRILGQYVGESEKNFKKCLLGAQSQQPAIVFVDEIDTAFKRGDERDSGVSRNIFSEFLQFTGNTQNRGKVIFIAATNRPDLLDPALKRAGRFDKKIPILAPARAERAAVFRVLIQKYRFQTDIPDLDVYAEKTRGYTGAEIETVLRKAYELACDAMPDRSGTSEPVIQSEHLSPAIDKCRPNTGQVELMTRLAVAECDDSDLLIRDEL